MRLLLIRHGKAGDSDLFARGGWDDDDRPLTADGRAEMRAVGRALAAAEPRVDVIATSPLIRALQTADAVAEAYPEARRETLDALRPGAAFADFDAWLRAHAGAALVAAVGHNPHLSRLATRLSGEDDVDMKKGSALLLELGAEPGAGAARVVWYRTARELTDGGR